MVEETEESGRVRKANPDRGRAKSQTTSKGAEFDKSALSSCNSNAVAFGTTCSVMFQLLTRLENGSTMCAAISFTQSRLISNHCLS